MRGASAKAYFRYVERAVTKQTGCIRARPEEGDGDGVAGLEILTIIINPGQNVW